LNFVDIHSVADLLKRHLRNLPDPLITTSLYVSQREYLSNYFLLTFYLQCRRFYGDSETRGSGEDFRTKKMCIHIFILIRINTPNFDTPVKKSSHYKREIQHHEGSIPFLTPSYAVSQITLSSSRYIFSTLPDIRQ
jgi:hypothetical protein